MEKSCPEVALSDQACICVCFDMVICVVLEKLRGEKVRMTLNSSAHERVLMDLSIN